MKDEQIFNDVAKWLEEIVQSISHGEASIKFVLHGGHVKRIEKSLIEKTQMDL